MAEERRRKRRGGRRRGRGRGQPLGGPAEGRPEEGQPEVPEVAEESEAPGVLPSRLRFRFGRRGGRKEEKARERRDQGREERPTAATPADISPLSFWRRGRTRTYREQPTPRQTLGRTWRRIRGLHFPPWVPVAFIIAIVSGILVILFIEPWGEGPPPHIGDTWQATYSVEICGQGQPPFDGWVGGVTTNGDGRIYLQPRIASEEGKGARLVKWFEYGGGKLTQTEMRMPDTREEYKNGDTCDDGSEAVLQVSVNGVKMDDWSDYIPQHGNDVEIVFGPEEWEDRTVIPESEATRTEELEISGEEGDAAFVPDSLNLSPSETIKLVVKNAGTVSHTIRVVGADGEYFTADDFVSDPDTILPGEEGVVVVRFDEEGEFEFQDPTALSASGTLVVTGEESPSPQEEAPAEEGTPGE